MNTKKSFFTRPKFRDSPIDTVDLAACAVLTIIGCLFVYWRSGYVFDDMNIDILVTRAHRILIGEIPYRDFFCISTPATYYLFALGMKIFGASYQFSRIYVALQCGFGIFATYVFCRFLLNLHPYWTAALTTLSIIWSTQVMWGYMWYDCDAQFFLLLTGILFYRSWTSNCLWCAFLAGVTCAFIFWCKQDTGIGALISSLIAAAIVVLYSPIDRRFLRLGLFILGISIILFAGATYFLHYTDLRTLSYWLVQRSMVLRWGHTAGGAALSPIKIYNGLFAGHNYFGKVLLLIYCLSFSLVIQEYYRSRDHRTIALAATLLIWMLTYVAIIISHSGEGFTMMQETLACSIAGMLTSTFFRKTWFRAGLIAGLLILGYKGVRYVSGAGYWPSPAPVTVTTERLRGVQSGNTMDEIVGFIQKIPEDEPVLLFYPLSLYFAANRNPTHPITVIIPGETLPSDDPKILESIERHQPRWFISKNKPGNSGCIAPPEFPKVQAYIKKHFTLRTRLTGFTVCVRRDPF